MDERRLLMKEETIRMSESRRRVSRSDAVCIGLLGMTCMVLLSWQPSTEMWTPVSRQNISPLYQTYDDVRSLPSYSVDYTARSFRINHIPTLLLGGSIHYPRATVEMWSSVLRKAKDDGLNHIEMYIFWNAHERQRGVLDFSGNKNLTQFYDLAAEFGLFLSLRIGPYVCAEYNNGGLPVWLNEIPNLSARRNNQPWKNEMERFVREIITLSTRYFAKNGGPIILAQIENEYNLNDQEYVDWCGELTMKLNVQVPWIMCNGMSAKNTIGACNDFDCVNFAHDRRSKHPNEPLLWTENEGWFQKWDGPRNYTKEDRSAEEISYAITRWFAIGGAHHNYYMYFGGNHYGRSAGGGITTMYADGVNLHSDGLDNEPKRTHLRRLHHVLAKYQASLLQHPIQLNRSIALSRETRAFIYGDLVFVENFHPHATKVTFQTQSYTLLGHSMLLLYQNALVFNTSDVIGPRLQRKYKRIVELQEWKSWSEPIVSAPYRKRVKSRVPLEQLSVTSDETDYLIYQTRNPLDAAVNFDLAVSTCESTSLLIYLNETFVTEINTPHHVGNCSRWLNVSLPSFNASRLTIVSISMGIGNLHTLHSKGLTGDILLGNQSIRQNGWIMYPGTIGETLQLFRPEFQSSVDWQPFISGLKPPMTWYTTSFRLDRKVTRQQDHSILINAQGLGRGRLYLNGHDLGRYWLISYNNSPPIQQYYHVPEEWLQQDNTLTVLEELPVPTAPLRLELVHSFFQDSNRPVTGK